VSIKSAVKGGAAGAAFFFPAISQFT